MQIPIQIPMQVGFIAIVVILILLTSCFLLIPFHLSLNLSIEGPLVQGVYRIAWLGLTLRKGAISPPPEELANAEKKEVQEKETEAESKDKFKLDGMRPPDPQTLMDALPAMAGVLRDLIKSINVDKISCDLSFGLDDPVETAVMSGYLWSVVSAFGLYRANIFIEPYFEGGRLEGNFKTELKARMLWAIVAMLKALKDEMIRKLVKEMARGTRA